jgi:tetratricopeptide (TPR) repeat protein
MDSTPLPAAQASANPDIAFLSASTLAANGRLEEAEALLSPDGRLPSAPQALDLLARIAIHSGDLKQARKLWEAALQAEPSYEPARRALQSLQTPWFALAVIKRIAFLLSASLAACLALIGVVTLLQPTPTTPPSPSAPVAHRPHPAIPALAATPQPKPPDPTPATPTNDSAQALKSLEQSFVSRSDQLATQIRSIEKTQAQLSQGQGRIAQQLDTLAASHQKLSTQQTTSQQAIEQTRRDLLTLAEAYANDHRPVTNLLTDAQSPPPLALDVRGTTIHPYGAGWEIRFDEPLFDRDAHFKLGSKALITSVAKALARAQEKITIHVVAFADNEPATWPWSKPLSDSALGRIRAERIKGVIDHLALIPPGALSATNGSPSDLPYPSEGRRNRTAVLRISRP